MRALKNCWRTSRRFVVRCRDTLWLNRRLGYPMACAWRRAGWWAM